MAGEIDVVHDHTLSGPLNAPIFAQLGLPVSQGLVAEGRGTTDRGLRVPGNFSRRMREQFTNRAVTTRCHW